MTSITRTVGAAIMLTAMAGFARPANASFIATMRQVGSNVVISGNGSFNTAGLTPTLPGAPGGAAAIDPFFNIVLLGGGGTNNAFTGLTPSSYFFGPPGVETTASSTSGAVLGIGSDGNGVFNSLYLPNGYVSGTSVSDVTTFAGTTFAGLGVTPGTYVWTWGSGANLDNFTLQIGPIAVPEPSSVILLGSGLLSLAALLLWDRSRKGSRVL